MQKYKISLMFLSPLHIGNGEQIEPFDYVIMDGKMYRFSLENIIKKFDQSNLDDFYSSINDDNILHLRELVIKHFDPIEDTLYDVYVEPKVEENYKNSINEINNQLLISTFIRDPLSHAPYIPGSSLKGCIRTAVLNYLKYKNEIVISDEDKSEKKANFETKILNNSSPTDDPFKNLKVPDIFIDNRYIKVYWVKNVLIENSRFKENSIKNFAECTYFELSNRTLHSNQELIIDCYIKNSMEINKKLIVDSCNYFYQNNLIEEINYFQNATDSENIIENLNNIKLLFEKYKTKDSFLLRVGRFSGKISKCISGMLKDKPLSRNIIDNRSTLGWLMVFLS